MLSFRYRLQTLLDQKIEAKNQAQAEVGKALRAVDEANRTLEELRNKEQALNDKKTQLRNSLFASESGQRLLAADLQGRTAYLRRLDAEVEDAGAEVFGQRIVIEECEDAVRETRRLLAEASRGVEVLEKHKSKLEERFRKEQERQEALQMDEAATAAFLRRQRSDAG
jgi:flagellar export protein FliJ